MRFRPNSRRPLLYPEPRLREALEQLLGLHADDHEARSLRTRLYRHGVPPPPGCGPNEMAQMLLALPPEPPEPA
jgi:hypothetical protein